MGAVEPMRGSCLCRKSTYELAGPPAMKVLCHCLSCRKLTGGTTSMTLGLPETSLKITSSSEFLTSVDRDHETGIPLKLRFCPSCGSAIYKTADSPMFHGMAIVFAGTLDQKYLGENWEEVKPDAEIWVKYRPKWMKAVDGAAQFEEWPEMGAH